MKLIDKQKALDALMAERKYLIARGQESAEHVLTHHAYNIIDEQPIIESRPKGKWIKNNTLINCSVCKHCSWSLTFEDTVRSFNYCPHCGADMRGEDNEVD